MTDLQQQQYLTDPRTCSFIVFIVLSVLLHLGVPGGGGGTRGGLWERKLIADFYMAGDARGPRGTLRLKQLTPGDSKSQRREEEEKKRRVECGFFESSLSSFGALALSQAVHGPGDHLAKASEVLRSVG